MLANLEFKLILNLQNVSEATLKLQRLSQQIENLFHLTPI